MLWHCKNLWEMLITAIAIIIPKGDLFLCRRGQKGVKDKGFLKMKTKSLLKYIRHVLLTSICKGVSTD